ncbi:MAG: MBL fold metallo-hydrolase [Rhodospirillaceae bacterium]|nr:MBL fold metallo-hydrolase [Rhodospirillaceae bacterium]
MSIPFVRDVEFEYGVVDQVSPLIRRVICNNPGGFTFHGTGTYIIGQGEVAVIDPGPLDDDHIAALERAVQGETVTHILITHTHRDHSPAAAPFKKLTGAPTYGYGPHGGDRGGPKVEEGGDYEFVPDHVIKDGDVIEGKGWTFEAIHTPGHTSNHICFALREENAIFTGDHVMGWSTSVISPPDGNMSDYMSSLRKILTREEEIYWPTHGPAITGPKAHVEAFITHRSGREDAILECIRDGRNTIPAMVEVMYADVDKRLHRAAGRSVFAHLLHMAETGRVTADGKPSPESAYTVP